MAGLLIEGPEASDPKDLADREYAEEAKTEDLDADGVADVIEDAFEGFATKSYVDTKDDLNATKAYVDAQDALRVRKTQVDTNGGPVSLSAAGKVARGRINVATTQRYPKGFYTPSAYHDEQVDNPEYGTEEVLFTQVVTSPGYAYKPVVLGSIDTMVTGVDDGTVPLIRVRLGADDGPVIASGYGLAEGYNWWTADLFDRTTSADLGSTYFTVHEGGGTGGYAKCADGQAQWVKSGAAQHLLMYRRTGTDAVTSGDVQTVSAQFATPPEATTSINGVGRNAFNYLLGRCSPDMKYWVGFAIGPESAQLVACMNGVVSGYNSVTGLDLDDADVWTARFGQNAGDPREFILMLNGEPVIWTAGSDAEFPRGPFYRGWGIGFRPGFNELLTIPTEQTSPASLNYVVVDEVVIDTETNPADVDKLVARHRATITPDGLSGISAQTGDKTLYVTLANTRDDYPGVVSALVTRPSLTVTTLSA